jgi:16S rRNA (cytosine967-C5)-methyltransferase
MTIFSLVSHSQELLRIILKSNQPADRLAADYLRRKKYIGSNDRKFISEVTFNTLRQWFLYNFISKNLINKHGIHLKSEFPEKNHFFETIVSIALTYSKNKAFDAVIDFHLKKMEIDEIPALINTLNEHFFASPDKYDCFGEIEAVLSDLDSKVNYIIAENSIDSQSVELLKYSFSLQEWILEILIKKYFILHTRNICHSLNNSAKVCLRINQIFASRQDVSAKLDKLDIKHKLGDLSPSCIILDNRVNISQTDLYKAGIIEVQDQGSQLISIALDPSPGDSVLDACAGAGGKTLHIADLMENKGHILASDIEFMRLKEISKRSHRSHFNSIKTKLIKKNQSSDPKLFDKKLFDKILVDAPCSGMGTVRRMPMPKYRLTSKLVDKLAKRQLDILTFYSQFLRPGGIILYATCSIMPQENEEVAEKFLAANEDFASDPLKPIFDKQNIYINGLSDEDYYLSLNPYDHESDGFFMARFRKEY